MPKFKKSLADFVAALDSSITTEVEIQGLPSSLGFPHWSQGQEVSIAAHFKLDVDEIRRQCRLSEGRVLVLAISAVSSHTKRKFTSQKHLVSADASLGLTVPAFEAGGTLEIATYLSVESPTQMALNDLEAPDHSVLWSDNVTCDLEGDSGRIAVIPTDFSKWDEVHSKSLWRIVANFPFTTDEWQFAELNTCIEVRFNKNRIDQLKEPAAKIAMTVAYLERIIDGLLLQDEIFEGLRRTDDGELGSLALTAKRLVGALLPNCTEAEVREKWHQERDHYVNVLQGIVGVAE